MSQIKSAVELALEKTRGLALSEKEKEKIKEEELDQRARGLVGRFLEVDLHLRELEKELERIAPEQRVQLEERIWRELVRAIQLDRDNDLAFEAIRTLAPASAVGAEEIQTLIREYQRRREEEFSKTQKKLDSQFVSWGIGGKAVRINVEGSQMWRESLAAMRPPFETKLRSLKEKMERSMTR